jgi:hypothetical protein
LWSSWDQNLIKTDNVAKRMSTIFSTKFRTNKEVGWILDIDYSDINYETIEKVNLQIVSSLAGQWSTKVNIIPLNFAFTTNLIEICLHVNQQKALGKQNFITIDL